MNMATYFTATSDSAATSALENLPVGDEVLTSVIAPHSGAFMALVQLIAGAEIGGLLADPFAVCHVVASSGTLSLIRLSSDLVAEIADRDVFEFGGLAGPWRRSGALDDNGGMGLPDYLIDLQHLARNAIAEKGGVYAIESL